MPTNPTPPISNDAIDRLTLGVASPRGTDPSMGPACAAGPSGFACACACACFETTASAVIFGCYGSACFEAEASGISMCACGCACFDMDA